MKTAKFKEGLLKDFIETSIALNWEDEPLTKDIIEYLQKNEWYPIIDSSAENLCYILLPNSMRKRQFHRGLLVEKTKFIFSNNTILKKEYVEIFKEMI
jgi:hypothetical protein